MNFESLAWTIAPITLEDFFANYWEKKPLVVHRKNPAYWGDLLRMRDIDEVLTTRQFYHPDVRLVTSEKETKVEDYTYPDQAIDARRLLLAFAEGQTIIINQLEWSRPALMEYVRGLENELSHRMQANIYLTPKAAQGFKSHYDSHDVFILQIHGSKHWVLYDTPIELPMRGQTFRAATTPVGPVSHEFVLQPGDLAYVPRGVMHDARTTGEDSLHITAGVLSTTWSDLLLEAVGHAAIAEPTLRRSLPVGFAREGFDRAAAAATMRAALQRVVDRLEPDALLDQAYADMVGTRPALLENQLDQILRLDEIAGDSRMTTRPKLMFTLRQTDEHVVLSVFGTDLRLPLRAAEPLKAALAMKSFVVRELPGDLDEAGKIVLVKRLVREGLLRRT